MGVQPGAELGVCNRQWLVLDNVFRYLAEDQGHRGEDQDAGDKGRTEIALCGNLFLHDWLRADALVGRG